LIDRLFFVSSESRDGTVETFGCLGPLTVVTVENEIAILAEVKLSAAEKTHLVTEIEAGRERDMSF